MSTRWSALVTVEHGGGEVPAELASLFAPYAELLRTHRGWDRGALALGRRLAEELCAPLLSATVTRLVVDLNRSPHNPRVFSEVTHALPRAERERLLERYHRPHRDRVAAAVAERVRLGERVLHLGVHSFVPVLDGVPRSTDLALLYDPSRHPEASLAREWTRRLADALPGRAVRRNHPYRGRDDGLTTTLRRALPETVYAGIEIEVNQKHVGPDGIFPHWVSEALTLTLPPSLAAFADVPSGSTAESPASRFRG